MISSLPGTQKRESFDNTGADWPCRRVCSAASNIDIIVLFSIAVPVLCKINLELPGK